MCGISEQCDENCLKFSYFIGFITENSYESVDFALYYSGSPFTSGRGAALVCLETMYRIYLLYSGWDGWIVGRMETLLSLMIVATKPPILDLHYTSKNDG